MLRRLVWVLERRLLFLVSFCAKKKAVKRKKEKNRLFMNLRRRRTMCSQLRNDNSLVLEII